MYSIYIVHATAYVHMYSDTFVYVCIVITILITVVCCIGGSSPRYSNKNTCAYGSESLCPDTAFATIVQVYS